METGIYIVRNERGMFYKNTKEGLSVKTVSLPYIGTANDDICFTQEEAYIFCHARIYGLFPELHSTLKVNNVYFNANNTMIIVGE